MHSAAPLDIPFTNRGAKVGNIIVKCKILPIFFYNLLADRYLSASIAAAHPLPAAVTACL